MSEFKKQREELLREHARGLSGLDFAARYTALVDELVTGLFREAGAPKGLALVALGGYGRGQMAPFSDVDLLFVHPSRTSTKKYESVIEVVLYPLWDLKLEVGHVVRTPAQGRDLARADFATLVSALESRFLAGSQACFAEFRAEIRGLLGSKAKRQAFFKELKAAIRTRHHKYGQTPYLLEPNVKEGQGGLRDIQAIVWAGLGLYEQAGLGDLAQKGLLPGDAPEKLTAAQDFMSRVRNQLHTLAGGRSDTLTFEAQEDLAAFFGLGPRGEASAVEEFMQAYYQRVYQVKAALDYFLHRLEEDLFTPRRLRRAPRARSVTKGLAVRGGLVELSSAAEVRQRPVLMMKAFETAAVEGLPLSPRSLELIRTNLDLVDDDYRQDPVVARAFLRALAATPPRTGYAPRNLEAMRDINLLAAYIPELAPVRARVQYDAYHVYTVDVHLVLTLWELKRIAAGLAEEGEDDFERLVLEEVSDREVLYLAGLLHDVGKVGGQDHALRGAELMPRIAARLGLSPPQAETLSFLVAEHVFLIETATRRDLSEEKLIVTCARRVKDAQRLRLLYLLTVADSRATGPGAWNQWKATLVRDLYLKVLHVLTRSDLADRESARRSARLRAEVVRRLSGRLDPERVEAHLEEMPDHYLSVTSAAQVARHVLLAEQLEGEPLVWEVETRPEGYCEVTILTRDRPGLLSRMAGVLTLHDINILGAQVFTWADQTAMDVFQVEPPPDRIYAEEAWERVRRDMVRALTGHLALDFRLARKRPRLVGKKTVPRRPPRIVLDNETSDFYTIVEVYTYDRLGLLYALTRTLFDLQLSIYLAKISTKVDQVVDVFYVTDFYGQKMDDEEQIRELKAALQFTLEE